jgi:hypothetical protein
VAQIRRASHSAHTCAGAERRAVPPVRGRLAARENCALHHLVNSCKPQKSNRLALEMPSTKIGYWLRCLALCIVASAAPGWSRGDYGVLSFAPGCTSYTFKTGKSGLVFPSKTGLLANMTGCTPSNGGVDSHGSFDELTLDFKQDGELAVRYYSGSDSFVFLRRPKTLNLLYEWPSERSRSCTSFSDSILST